MGDSSFTFDDFLKRTEISARRGRRMGPVGERGASTLDLTCIEKDKDTGQIVFGNEIQAMENLTHRPFPRDPDNWMQDNLFLRMELDFEKDELRGRGYQVGSRVIWVDLPGGFRSVFTAKVQSCGASGNPENFPTYDDPSPNSLAAKDNPLGLGPDPDGQRASQSDFRGLLEVHAQDRDIYLNKTANMRASFAVNRMVSCYFPHKIQPRWRGIRTPPNRGEGPRRRYGIVADLNEAIGLIHQDLKPIVQKRMSAIEKDEAFKSIGENYVKLNRKLAEYVDDIVDISILQSLGGLSGRADDPHINAPVYKLAARYMDEHLLSLNKSLEEEVAFEGERADGSTPSHEE
ncbi:MAG: hypothetical protein AAF986_09440, partial [Pseudomonadota bacterium]